MPRGFLLTSPRERSELLFAVPGEAKYKISIFDHEANMKPAKQLYDSASRIVGLKNFFIKFLIKYIIFFLLTLGNLYFYASFNTLFKYAT